MMETTHLLPALGFTPAPNAADKKEFILHLGPLKLSAARTQNLYFREVVIFWSSYVTPNTLSEIYFELPKEIQSLAHVKAFLSYYLKGHVGRDTIPKPLWFDEGMSLAYLLPWEVESPKYESPPHCYVRKDWMKLMLRDLASALKTSPDAQVEFCFDGTVLSVNIDGRRIVTSAEGKAWDSAYSIPAFKLANLPSRLRAGSIELGIYQDRLRLGHCSYAGITTGAVADRYESLIKPAIAAAWAEVDQGNTSLETMVNLLNKLEAVGLNQKQISTMKRDIVRFAEEEFAKINPEETGEAATNEESTHAESGDLKPRTQNLLSQRHKTVSLLPEVIWQDIRGLVATEIQENEAMVADEMYLRGIGEDPSILLLRMYQVEPKQAVLLIRKEHPELEQILNRPLYNVTPEQQEQIVYAVLDLFTPAS